MSRLHWSALFPLTVIGLAAGTAVLLAGAPPLSLEGYLDEKLPEADEAAAPALPANEPCFVCHGNFREERLVTVHAAKKVGCVKCHGESVAHRNDEGHRTPPERMFAPEAVDPLCRKCHKKHDVPARKVVALLQERGLQDRPAGQLTCTSCHFDHRIAERTVRWDRHTGRLLERPAEETTR